MSDELVTIHDIARHLGATLVDVYRWISTRKMPAHLIDGEWRFGIAEVDEWHQKAGDALAAKPAAKAG